MRFLQRGLRQGATQQGATQQGATQQRATQQGATQQGATQQGDACRQDGCVPSQHALDLMTGCQPPGEEAILEQYAVLTAILGSPEKGFFKLKTEPITIVGPPTAPDNKPTLHNVLVVDETNGLINFPGALGSKSVLTGAPTPFACNFFAPMPPSAPVKF